MVVGGLVLARAVVVVGHQPYSLSVARAAERLKGDVDVELFYRRV